MTVRLEDGPLPTSRILTFSNPPADVLTLELIAEATEAIRGLPPDTTFLLIRSSGETFCAGVDVAIHTPEITVGCFPPVAVALLPDRVGRQRVADMVYSGRPIPATEAFRIGLVSRLASEGELELERLLEELGGRSRAVLRTTRSAMIGTRRAGWKERIRESERIYLERLIRSRDAREGVEAFADRRPPRWRHE